MASKRTLEIILKATDQASKVILNVSKDLGGIGKAGVTAALGIKVVNKGIDTAFKTYQGVMSSGIVQAAGMVHELARFGAQSKRTEQAFEAISGGAYEADQRLAAMTEATRGAMSEQQAMASANQLMQMGLASNAEELGNVTEMATRLGSAMGRTAGESIEQFSLLLANQSIPRLDTFGISAGKVRTRIKELQAATEGLTREDAFMIAVTEEGTKAMDRLGDAVEDDMLKFERLEAQMANTKVELAQKVTPAWAGFLDLINRGLGEAGQWNKRWKQAASGVAALGISMISSKETAAKFLEGLNVLDKEEVHITTSTQDLANAQLHAVGAFDETTKAVEDEADALSSELDIALSKAKINTLQMAQGWTNTLSEYTDYLAEREQLTLSAEEEIAAIEAEYAGRRFETVRASDEEISAFQIEAAGKEAAALRAIDGKKTEEEKAAAQLRYDQMVSANGQKLGKLQGYSVMAEGITREEADKRIAAVQEGQAEELAALEEGNTKKLAEQRKHFGEMQIAYLENRLKSEELTVEQREATEKAMQGIGLEFGLVTEDSIKFAEAEGILQDALGTTSTEAVPEWLEAMSKYEGATADGIITTEELKGIMDLLSGETGARLLEVFPEINSVLDKSTEKYRLLRDAAGQANDAMAGISNMASTAGTLGREGGARGVPGLQHGTPNWGGGPAIVGEGGPEALFLPPGSRVEPNYSPVTQSVTNNRNTTHNYNVNDQLAAAMILDQQRRAETAQLNAMM